MNEFELDDDFESDDDFEDTELEDDTTPEPDISEQDKIEQRLNEIEATPGFMDGKLRISSNPADRAKHEQIMCERSKLIQRQNAQPGISAEDLTDEGQKKIKAELETLEDTPGFLDGTLARSNDFADRERHAELMEKRGNLIARLLPDENEPSMQEIEEQGNRIRQAKRDMQELVAKHGYQEVHIPRSLSEKDAAGLHLQLLSARGDFKEFANFAFSIQKRVGFSEEQLSTMRGVARLNISTAKKQEICDKLLMAIFEGKD